MEMAPVAEPRGRQPRLQTPLREYIDAKGLKHTFVARQLGLTPAGFSNWLNGYTQMRQLHVAALVGIFGEEVRGVAERHIEVIKQRGLK
jgi:hypothetical protein